MTFILNTRDTNMRMIVLKHIPVVILCHSKSVTIHFSWVSVHFHTVIKCTVCCCCRYCETDIVPGRVITAESGQTLTLLSAASSEFSAELTFVGNGEVILIHLIPPCFCLIILSNFMYHLITLYGLVRYNSSFSFATISSSSDFTAAQCLNNTVNYNTNTVLISL